MNGEDYQGSENAAPADGTAAASPTLCDLFARTLARRPDALALSDPLNKSRVTGQQPQKLTYAQADRIIASLAAQLVNAGLPPGSVIGVQLANTVEYPLVLLAAWRAGLTVALLPQLWRRAELADALGRVNARAIVCASRIEIADHSELAMHAAADVFSVRHVFGIGDPLTDGMTPLVMDAADIAADIPQWPSLNVRKAAIISFDVTADGLVAVPRSHVNLIAGGLAISMESSLPPAAKILSCIIPSSFAGLASSTLTWLLSGGSLSLHHPFDLETLQNQIDRDGCNTLIAPAYLALRLAQAGAIDAQVSLRHVIGLWRTPERTASSDDWHGSRAALTDVYLFGETGLFSAQRMADGSPAPIAESLYRTARAPVEILLTPRGSLGLRGAITSRAAYKQASTGDPSLEPAPDYVDTGYAARRDPKSGAIYITAPPAGLAGIGYYRYRLQDLDNWAAHLASGATLTALPDQLNGYRLAGRATDNTRAREALAELGLGPLMSEAFRERNATAPN